MKKIELFTKPGLLPAMLVAATLFVLMAFAPALQSGDEGWTLLSSESGVNAYVTADVCGKNAMYVFKLVNTTNKSVSLSYTLTASTDPTFPPITKETVLQPNQSVIGSCDALWQLALPNTSGKTTELQNLVTVSLRINP